MKKFFKALALVLALTLVVGTIPASAAEYDFSLKKDKKIIYLGGAQGEKEVDGATVKCGTKSRYKISKLVNGFDASTMDIKLESSDKSIVKTSNAKDKVYAKSIGTADVTIYVYDKETDKQLKSLTVKVQVKKNATAPLAFVITDSNGKPVDLTATKAGVNVPYIVTLPRKDADGNFVDTDYRVLSSTDESVQIEAINKYGTQYKVTFTKSGTFPITAASYQSKIWNKLQNVVTVPVTAGYDANGVEQASLDTAKVTFDTPVVGLTADNFKAVYTLDGVEEVEIPFTDVAPDGISYNEDKTAAYVKFLVPFAPNTNYIIYFDGKVAGNFKAVEVKADSVKTFVIPTQYIQTDSESTLKYQLLDANGVDITAGVNAVGGSVTFELTSDDANDYIVGEKIYVKNAHAVTVTGTYHYFDSESNYKSEPVGKGQVVAQIPEQFKAGKVEGIVTDLEAAALVGGDYKVNDKVAPIEWTLDGDAEALLQIKVPYTKSTGTLYEGFGATNLDGTYKGYTIDIADKTVALSLGEYKNGIKLKANKAGSTAILIYGTKSSDGTSVVIGVVNVTVKEARKLSTWTVKQSSDKLNLDFGDVTYSVTAKDQEGKDYLLGYNVKVYDVTGKEVTGYDSVLIGEGSKVKTDKSVVDVVIDHSKITSTATTEKAVTHNIKIVVNDDEASAKTLRLSVKHDGTDAKRYVLKLSGTELKTGVTKDTQNSGINITLDGLTSNGTPAPATGAALTFKGSAVRAHANEDKGAEDNTFYFTITKDGKLLEKAPAQLAGATLNAFGAPDAKASDAAVKLDKGTYVINAYRVYLNDAKTTYIFDNLGSAQTITVTDDQAAIASKKVADEVATFTDADVVGAFEITINGSAVKYDNPDYAFIVEKNVDSTNTTAYIKAIKVVVLNGTVGNYTYTINPDTTLKIKK